MNNKKTPNNLANKGPYALLASISASTGKTVKGTATYFEAIEKDGKIIEEPKEIEVSITTKKAKIYNAARALLDIQAKQVLDKMNPENQEKIISYLSVINGESMPKEKAE